MVECIYISCCDVLDIWCGLVYLECVVITWFEFKSCILTSQPTLKAF